MLLAIIAFLLFLLLPVVPSHLADKSWLLECQATDPCSAGKRKGSLVRNSLLLAAEGAVSRLIH